MTAITLYDQRQGHNAMQAVWQTIKPILAHKRLVLRVEEPKKSRDQEKKYHAQIAEIAAQYEHAGRKWDAEDMKRLLVAAFKEDTKADPDLLPYWREMGQIELAPAIRGGGFVLLGTQTKKFPKPLAAAFITWLDAFAAENGIEFTDAGAVPSSVTT